MADAKKSKGKGTAEKSVDKRSRTEHRFDDLLTTAVSNRRTGNFWDLGGSTGSTADSSTGGDWEERWDLQDKFAIAWWGRGDGTDRVHSNVKSPEIVGRLQSTMQKLSGINLEWVAKPKREEAKFAAEITQLVMNEMYRRNMMNFKLGDIFYDALRHGTCPATVDFVTRYRDVKVAVTDADQMTDEEKEDVKSGKQVYRKAKIMDLREIVLNNRNIRDIYVDPNARVIHGEVYNAQYYFIVTRYDYDHWKSLHKGKSGYKDIDKVLPAGKDERDGVDNTEPFFPLPEKEGGDYVVQIEMFHLYEDLHMVRANGVYIKESPLPYNHKQLNLLWFTPFKLPEQLYGIGLVDLLVPIVTQIENIQNAVYDFVNYTTNPVLMIERRIYNEFSRVYRKAKPGLMIPVADPNRAATPLKYQPLSMDVFQALQSLQRDAVVASQVDPSQLGVVRKNATATANIMNKEIAEAYVNFVIHNFTRTLTIAGQQMQSLIHQFLTKKEVYDIINGDNSVDQVSKYRVIPVYDKKVEIDWDNKEISIENAPGVNSSIELSPDLFKVMAEDENGEEKEIMITPDDVDVYLNPESVQVVSRALELQRKGEEFAQLSQFMVDPSDRQKVAQHPLPLIDATSYMEEWFEDRGISKKHLLRHSGRMEKDIDYATEQNEAMFKGQDAIPEPGMTKEHLQVHEDFINVLAQYKKTLDEQYSKYQMEAQAAMQMGQMAPQPDAQLVQSLQSIGETIARLKEHLAIDSQPVWTGTDAALQAGMPKAGMPMGGAQQGGMGGNTMMGGTGGLGGTPAMPNMPRQAGYTQGGAGQLGGLM